MVVQTTPSTLLILGPVRFSHLAAALLVLLSPLAMSGRLAAQPREEAAQAARAEAPELTEQDMLFAYHRMAGTEPDFQVLAELAVDSRPEALRGVRDPVRERRYLLVLAERRLKAEFAGFDLNRAFTLQLGAEILGYDRERGGIPLRAGVLRGLSLRDPTDRNRGFVLRLRQAGAVTVIPTADEAAAASLLQAAGLASLGDWAGMGRITLQFVFAGVLPKVAEASDAPVIGEIIGARVESQAGVALHAFRSLGSRMAAAAARRAGPPVLARAELAGLRIGMPLAEAEALALRGHPDRLDQAFFDRLPEAARRGLGRPHCSAGLVADLRAFDLPLAPQDSFASCLALVVGEEGDPLASQVTELSQLRFLPDAAPGAVRQELVQQFGPPLEELADGRLVWAGRDPAQGAGAGLLELRATFVPVAEGGPQREAGILLALTLQRHVAPEQSGS